MYHGCADKAASSQRKGKSEGDGVVGVYREIHSKVPALNAITAPALMEYLASG